MEPNYELSTTSRKPGSITKRSIRIGLTQLSYGSMCITCLCFSTMFLFKIFRLHSLCILHGAGGGHDFEGRSKNL